MATLEVQNADTAALRILMIEDNDTDYLLLHRYIRKTWPAAICGRAARRAEVIDTLTQHWNLIITDYHLIDIEGSELLGTIAAKHPNTPCVILSGSILELREIDAPPNVFSRLEKGDYAGLSAALASDWQ